ncbi:hypothetical protein M378DRAFT_8799 [Amanita muscaria Koide BX008]|uniref:EF-hand domain-containing protein n=1 Tax=Amanita muscaria (strain Koide BX008) TaxID=946122 RepID=A0A0C2SXB4_AMAMK|nr:hypothetical protein M378DRAFT_8799 [Amanita muscaria Koide BX008]
MDNRDFVDLSPDEIDAKPTYLVHYPDEVTQRPEPRRVRTESSDLLGSRAPSVAATDDESDDFDWSGEEDLADEEAKYEKNMGVKGELHSRWGVRRAIIVLFSSLIGSLFIAGLIITPGILVQFLWYNQNQSNYRSYVKDNVQSWLFWMASNLVISWCLAILVDLVPTVISYFLSVTWGHISESVKSQLELYLSVKNTFKPVLYAASGWLSWVIIFVDIYGLYDMSEPDNSRAYYLYRIYQAVQFLFFLTLVICTQRMLSHMIAFRFHRTAYKERIEYVKKALSVIEKLRQYRPKPHAGLVFGHAPGISDKEHHFLSNAVRHVVASESRRRQTVVPEEHCEADLEDNAMYSSKRKGKNRVSGVLVASRSSSPERASPSSAAQNTPPASSGGHHYPPASATDHGDSPTIVQAAKVFKQAVLHDARNLRGENNGPGALSWDVTSSREAKRLARNIYNKLKQRNRQHLLPSDFYTIYHDEALAEAAFRVFDKDNHGDISRAEIKMTIVKVYRERRILSRSMRDVGEALTTLNRILLSLALLVLFFISLSVFGLDFTKSLTSIYSIFVAGSFVFKSSASSAFDAIMFIFVTHPFDTGDRCLIGTENLVVKKVGLFATVFTRSDGTETYYFNSQLFNIFIVNYRRSDKPFENLTMQVAWRTPLKKLDALERCLNEWLSTEENRWFEPSTSITLQHIYFQSYLEITIGIGHNGNWQDWGLRKERKTAFHVATQYYCRQLGIICYQTPIPVITDDVSNDQLEIPPSPTLSPVDSDTISQKSRNATGDGISVAAFEMEQRLAAEQEREVGDLRPTLSFMPPASARASRLKARKSKSRKPALHAAI